MTVVNSVPPAASKLSRVRHETKRRRLKVVRREALSPNLIRVTLTGDELAGFLSLGFDDHIKLFFAGTDGQPAMRDFTPRRYDPSSSELDIEFALHETGPASDWARSAQIGSELEIGGPRGSMVIEDSFDWYLLVGDETALPAIARRLEELRPVVPVTVIVEVDGAADEIKLATPVELTLLWVHRSAGNTLAKVLVERRLPEGEGFVWIAAEAATAKTLRGIVVDGLGHPRELTKAAGYWQRGEVGVHQVISDDATPGSDHRR